VLCHRARSRHIEMCMPHPKPLGPAAAASKSVLVQALGEPEVVNLQASEVLGVGPPFLMPFLQHSQRAPDSHTCRLRRQTLVASGDKHLSPPATTRSNALDASSCTCGATRPMYSRGISNHVGFWPNEPSHPKTRPIKHLALWPRGLLPLRVHFAQVPARSVGFCAACPPRLWHH
jgi:hypothetical protein